MTYPSTEPLGIYIHVPFCEQKCAYCDFFTVTDPQRSHPLFENWLSICLAELRLWFAAYPGLLQDRSISTIFFGGGTPSLLSPFHFEQFLQQFRAEFPLAPDAEISLETQPGTIAEQDFPAMVHAGINRFSVGAQTFNRALLQPTARRHTVEETEHTLRLARATGAVLAVDLIGALPGQTLPQWQADLARALEFDPHHISVYEMTYHAGTDYYRQWKRGTIRETDENLRIAMFQHTHDTLTRAGYHLYEISNYARPGMESRHNRIYWTLGDFIGLGAGAYSFLGGHRYANPRSAADYAKAIGEGRLFARPHDSSDPDITLVENLQMALRLLDGVNLNWLAGRLGQDIRHTRSQKLLQLQALGWIELTTDTIRLTPTGILQADSVSEMLL